MKAKTLLIGLMAAFATVLAACGGGNSSSKAPSVPSSSVPTPSPSTPTPSVSTPTPSVSTPTPSVSTPTPSVSTPTPSVSTPDVEPDPTPDPIVPDAPVEGNLFVANGWQEGEELTADENEGAKIIYWADTNWTGSLVTATTSVEDGVFKIDGTQVSGYCWHGLQAFINVPNNAAGDTYNVSLTLKSSVAGKIHFNGQVVDLVVGDNELTSTVTVIATNRWDGAPYITAPVSIQFGAEQANQDANKAMQNGEYELSNIVIEKATGGSTTPDTPNPEPDNPVVPEPGDLKGLFTVIANATVGAANNYTIKWNDAAYAVTQQASITDCTVSPGIVVNLEYFTVAGDGVTFNIITGADVGRVVSIVLHTAQGDYKVSMILDGNTYADYTVEKVDCTHASSSEPSEPVDIFEQTSGQFNYSGEAALGTKELSFWNWRVQENLETPERGEDKNTVATYDAETKTFHYSSYAEAGEWWHDQFFYKSGVSGQVKVSFTITVAGFEGETGEITINGQVYTVTNGQALDVEYNTFNATTISIQLGKAGGTNLTGYLNVTISGMSIVK